MEEKIMSKLLTGAELFNYVNSLEVPVLSPQVSAPVTDSGTDIVSDDAKAAVAKGQLVGFVDGLSAKSKSDVLNSCLLAQLNSDKVIGESIKPTTDTQSWYANYTEVLSHIGWTIGSFNFVNTELSGSSYTVASAIIDLISAIASESPLTAITSLLNAVKAITDSNNAWNLFSHNSYSDQAGSFQVGVCDEATNGAINMYNTATYFSGATETTNILWYNWSNTNAKVYNASAASTLNTDVYSQVRAKIISKLGAAAQLYVDELEI
jgi:hypothetical protein